MFANDPTGIKDKLGGSPLPMEYFLGIEYPPEGGILSRYLPFRFPKKGIPLQESIDRIGTVKKIIRNSIWIIVKTPLKYVVLFGLFLPANGFKIPYFKKGILAKRYLSKDKIILEAIEKFNDICDQIMRLQVLTPNSFCTCAREVYFKGKAYIDTHYTGRKQIVYERLLYYLCHIIELDTAYRYRFQDIMMELIKANFRKNPAKELKRLLGLIIARERSQGLRMDKYRPFFLVAYCGFKLRPSFRKKVIEFVETLDTSGESWENIEAQTDWLSLPDYSPLQRIGFDHADWYDVMNGVTYDSGDVNLTRRMALRKKIDTEWMNHLTKKYNTTKVADLMKALSLAVPETFGRDSLSSESG